MHQPIKTLLDKSRGSWYWTCSEKIKDVTIYGIIVSCSYWLCYHNINLLFSSASNFSQTDKTLSYNQQNTIYSLQQRNTVDFGLWFWFNSFERKGSIWKPYNQLPGNSAGSLVLLLSQRQEFLENHLPWVPVTHNQQGTFEMREEVISSVGAQDTDTRGYELSDLEDRRHWIQMRRSCSWYGQCLSTWNWYSIFPIHLLTIFKWRDQPLSTQ